MDRPPAIKIGQVSNPRGHKGIVRWGGYVVVVCLVLLIVLVDGPTSRGIRFIVEVNGVLARVTVTDVDGGDGRSRIKMNLTIDGFAQELSTSFILPRGLVPLDVSTLGNVLVVKCVNQAIPGSLSILLLDTFTGGIKLALNETSKSSNFIWGDLASDSLHCYLLADDGLLSYCELNDPTNRKSLPGDWLSVTMSHDRKVLFGYSSDDYWSTIDIDSNREIDRIKTAILPDLVTAAPSGRWLLACGAKLSDPSLTKVDFFAGTVTPFSVPLMHGNIWALAIAEDETKIAIAGNARMVVIIDPGSGKEIARHPIELSYKWEISRSASFPWVRIAKSHEFVIQMHFTGPLDSLALLTSMGRVILLE